MKIQEILESNVIPFKGKMDKIKKLGRQALKKEILDLDIDVPLRHVNQQMIKDKILQIQLSQQQLAMDYSLPHKQDNIEVFYDMVDTELKNTHLLPKYVKLLIPEKKFQGFIKKFQKLQMQIEKLQNLPYEN